MEKKEIRVFAVNGSRSPIYMYDITGELRSFWERLIFPISTYKKGGPKYIAPKKIRTVFLYTMNVTEETKKKTS